MKRILLIQGHPDPAGGRFGHALADAYAQAAAAAGHQVERIEVAALDFPLLQTKAEFEDGAPCPDIAAAQRSLMKAEHVVIAYPLWLGGMPSLLKGFLEQLLRPGFAFSLHDKPMKKLRGRTARVIITMGMPALAYRWYFGAYGLKMLKRSILGFCGIGPVAATLVGSVEGSVRARGRALDVMRRQGARGA